MTAYTCACRCDNSSTLKGTLIALSTLAPQYLLMQSTWLANQHRVKPQSYPGTCSNPASAQQDIASLVLSSSGSLSDLTQDSSDSAAHVEVLNELVSLLENAAGDLALLVAASVYRLVISTPCLAERMAQGSRFACTMCTEAGPVCKDSKQQQQHEGWCSLYLHALGHACT